MLPLRENTLSKWKVSLPMCDKHTVQKNWIYLHIIKHMFIFEKSLIWITQSNTSKQNILQSSKWLHHPVLFCKSAVKLQSWFKTTHSGTQRDDTIALRFGFCSQLYDLLLLAWENYFANLEHQGKASHFNHNVTWTVQRWQTQGSNIIY